MGDFGVELDGVEVPCGVLHGGDGAVIGGGGGDEAFRQHGDAVGMAHPDGAFGGHVREQFGGGVDDAKRGLAVLRGLGGLDAAVRHPRHELTAVADAEHGDAEVEDGGVEVRGGGVEDAVGAAGEDDAFIAGRTDGFRCDAVEGDDLGVDAKVAHASCDELVILAAEVEDEDLFHRRHPFKKTKRQTGRAGFTPCKAPLPFMAVLYTAGTGFVKKIFSYFLCF